MRNGLAMITGLDMTAQLQFLFLWGKDFDTRQVCHKTQRLLSIAHKTRSAWLAPTALVPFRPGTANWSVEWCWVMLNGMSFRLKRLRDVTCFGQVIYRIPKNGSRPRVRTSMLDSPTHGTRVSATHAGLGYARLMFIFVYLLRKMMPRRLRQVGSCLRTLCGGISALKFGSRPRILRSHPRILRYYCLLGTQGGYSCGAGADWFRGVSWGSSAAHALWRFLVQLRKMCPFSARLKVLCHPTPPHPSSYLAWMKVGARMGGLLRVRSWAKKYVRSWGSDP